MQPVGQVEEFLAALRRVRSHRPTVPRGLPQDLPQARAEQGPALVERVSVRLMLVLQAVVRKVMEPPVQVVPMREVVVAAGPAPVFQRQAAQHPVLQH